ncbi:MAG TPA: hypothetical protein VM290_09295 [Gaiellaceae bacterium]|nr:hypothetical protein [Gaiellaceae bacterium]
MRSLFVLAVVAAALALPSAQAASPPDLHAGGYVLFVAHAGTGKGCALDGSRVQRASAAVSRHAPPVARVLAAPDCVARGTAQALFGRAAAAAPLGPLPPTPAARRQRLAQLERLLAAAPPAGKNTVLVGHPATLAALRGVRLGRVDAAVFQPGARAAVARVAAGGWDALLRPRTPSRFQEWDVRGNRSLPRGVHPHDIWPAGDGTVWYTGQFNSTMGRLNPATGRYHEIPLGAGASPHGVISDAAGNAWITDQGLNAIVRVDRITEQVTVYPIPAPQSAPNTATFDKRGVLWFTGYGGWYGRLDPRVGTVEVWPAPRGFGPYGIDTTPAGDVWFVSLDGGYLARIDVDTAALTVYDPPSRNAGTRRVWSDSRGRLWVTESNARKLALYDPAAAQWREWNLPAGAAASPYAVWVDEQDKVWITDFGTNALLRFDPATERFESFPYPSGNSLVRQIVGADGVLWGAASGRDKIVAFRMP